VTALAHRYGGILGFVRPTCSTAESNANKTQTPLEAETDIVIGLFLYRPQ